MGDLLNTVLGTSDARDPHMEVRRDLAYVEVTKLPFLRMIIHRAKLLADRAREAYRLLVIDVDIYPGASLVEYYLRDVPRGLKA